MALTQAEIDELIDDNILTGGRRTFAVGTREVLHEINSALFANNLTLTTYNPNPLQRVYQVGNTCVQNDKIYICIAETSGAFDIYDWEEISIDALAEWGSITGTITDQTDLTTYLSSNYQAKNTTWALSGNTIASRQKLGASAGSSFGWDYIINDITVAGYYNSGNYFQTGKLLQGYNDESLLSGRNVVLVADTNDGSTKALTLYASGFGTPLLEVLTDGKLKLSESIYDSSSSRVMDIPNRLIYSSPGFGSVGAISANDFALYPNNSFSSLNWLTRIWKDSSNDTTGDWENREFTKDWKFNGNVGIGGSSYGSGVSVMFIVNGTAPSSDPTGGGILYVESGALKYRGSSGTITTLGNA